jgi:hypothetical protein
MLVFARYPVQISTGLPAIITEVPRDFPQSLKSKGEKQVTTTSSQIPSYPPFIIMVPYNSTPTSAVETGREIGNTSGDLSSSNNRSSNQMKEGTSVKSVAMSRIQLR